jgi:hypothetical protein
LYLLLQHTFMPGIDCLPPFARDRRKHARRFAHGRHSAHSRTFGGVQPLTKPCLGTHSIRLRIGRVSSNLLDARLVQLATPASPRVVHPQASSPSFQGALRQSSPKVARSACYTPCFSLPQHSSLRICSKVILSPSIDEVNWVLLSLLWSHILSFNLAT